MRQEISLFMREVHFKYPLHLLLKLISYDSRLLLYLYTTLIMMECFSFFVGPYSKRCMMHDALKPNNWVSYSVSILDIYNIRIPVHVKID